MSGAARAVAGASRARGLGRAALALAVAMILAVTLVPSSNPEVYATPAHCILCGERGASDALANIILFVPLGVLLVLCGGRRTLPLALAGAGLSLGIELTQSIIPGRDPSLGDVLFNTTGTTLGAAAALHAWWWLEPPARLRRPLVAAAALLVPALVCATGVLLAPSGTGESYYGQWTPEQAHLEHYEGRVLRATVGDLAVGDGEIRESARAEQLLRGGAPVRMLAVAGPVVPGLAPVFSIMDASHREILLIGVDRDGDLVVRYRLRASTLRLDWPDLRLRGALAGIAPGDTLRIAVWRERGGHCIELNGAATCGMGFPAGRGWALVLYPEHLPPWAHRLLDLLWIAAAALPAGLWVATRGELATTGLAVLAALMLVPSAVGLMPAGLAELGAGAAGVAAGAAAGGLLRRACGGAPSAERAIV